MMNRLECVERAVCWRDLLHEEHSIPLDETAAFEERDDWVGFL